MNRKTLNAMVGLAVIAVAITCPLAAQIAPEQRLTQAYALVREAKPAQAIPELQALLDSKSLDAPGVGKAWNILGLAYEDEGSFADAQHAFEHSIRAFEGLPENVRDYAMALDDLGGLYVTTGQLELATSLRVKALQLYEKINDHAGMARSSRDLAGGAFDQKKIKEGRKYLERALHEARLTNSLDGDDLAAIASMQGWLAQYEGDFGAAASSYQRSLDLLRKRHGEEHPFTGWGYMLLGKAHVETGAVTTARTEMEQGLAILGRTLNHQDARYLTAELAYSRVLDATGSHVEAAQLKSSAERGLKESRDRLCIGCTVNVAAFR